MSSVEAKRPNEAPVCQRCSPSPLQVLTMPVGPTGGERPQARASRGWQPSQTAKNEAAARRVRGEASGTRRHGSTAGARACASPGWPLGSRALEGE